MPDPEILIRTGGNQRLSNFMLWQLAYTELFFLKKLWPDLKSIDLKNIIKKFKKIKKKLWCNMIEKNLKKRIFTSIALLFAHFIVFFIKICTYLYSYSIRCIIYNGVY